jgi:hypothetical protein
VADPGPPGPESAGSRKGAMKATVSLAPWFLFKLKASERSRGVRWLYLKELANGQDTRFAPPGATAQNAVRGLKPGTLVNSRRLTLPKPPSVLKQLQPGTTDLKLDWSFPTTWSIGRS